MSQKTNAEKLHEIDRMMAKFYYDGTVDFKNSMCQYFALQKAHELAIERKELLTKIEHSPSGGD